MTSTPEFYTTKPGKQKIPQFLVPGLFVNAPFLFLDNPSPLILRFDIESNPELLDPPPLGPEDYWPNLEVSLQKNPTDAFNEDLPELKKLGLYKKEEFMVLKAKIRPGIILSSHTFNQQSETVLVIPTFTLDKPYIPKETKEAIRTGQHPKYFYLPESESLNIKESFADFSQIQSISISKISLTRKCLSNLALQSLYAKLASDHTDILKYLITDFSDTSSSIPKAN